LARRALYEELLPEFAEVPVDPLLELDAGVLGAGLLDVGFEDDARESVR
jgi:hypothetical protein